MSIWDAVNRFFGPSHNNKFAELLQQLAATCVACAVHMRETRGQDLAGTIKFEHEADSLVDDIHELLDNSFIMRFDIGDSMKLTDDLDDVIDGMRKVAIVIDTFKPLLSDLRPEAIELMDTVVQMSKDLAALIAMIGEPRLSLASVRVAATKLDDAESAADKLMSAAERRLVTQYSPAGANRLEFLAWDKLFQLLEQVTDDANRVGKAILSLARKEA
jgi:hypothetical protein